MSIWGPAWLAEPMPVASASARAAVCVMGLMAMPWVVEETPPKITLGLPKKTVPPLAVPLPVTFDPKKKVKVVLLVTLMLNTPLRLLPVGLPLVLAAGTPLIRTVAGGVWTGPATGVPGAEGSGAEAGGGGGGPVAPP